MAVWAVLDRDPQTQGILNREHCERDVFDPVKCRPVAARIFRHGFERDCDQIDHNERDQRAVDPCADTVAYRPLLEHLVDASAQIPGATAGHP
jgi:hypothetical protein